MKVIDRGYVRIKALTLFLVILAVLCPLAASADDLSYQLPQTNSGNPPTPPTYQYVGGILKYDNGGTAPDDDLISSIPNSPEPSTVFLLGLGLAGLAGAEYGKKKLNLRKGKS